MKLIRKICLIILIVIGCFFIGYAIGKHFESTNGLTFSKPKRGPNE